MGTCTEWEPATDVALALLLVEEAVWLDELRELAASTTGASDG